MGRSLKVLLDSCVLIDHLGGHAAARDYLKTVRGGAIGLITWIEVSVGGQEAADQAVLQGFLANFEVLPVDQPVAEATVQLRRHRRLKLPDAVILATARVHGRVLATRNTKDFSADEPGVAIPYVL